LGYSAGLAYGQPIKAVHIQELRDRLLQVWSADIRWLVTDQLGTPRMIFDQSGSLATVSRHDYLPFGEELFAGSGGRTTAQGYTNNDVVRQKFTLKERDNETGLDYFGARYYSSTQGRFTSVDPENTQAMKNLRQPQSWNAYSYVNNNPLRFLDPDGDASNEDDPSYWQQLKEIVHNGVTYGYWMTNDELHAAATAARTQVASTYGQIDSDGILHPIDLSRVSDGQALMARDQLVALDEAGKIGNKDLPLGDPVPPPIGLGEKPPNGGTKPSSNNPGSALTKSEARKLGGLASRAEEKVAEVIRSRGGTGANVREAGPWAQKTLAETAKAATNGDATAETAIKIAKQAGRLGQKQ
jgi:RHS repeat-associated protein